MTYSSHGLGRQHYGCACSGSQSVRMARWVVLTLRANYSAFNGYRRTPSDYSEVRCLECGRRWRTKAAYVDNLNVAEEPA